MAAPNASRPRERLGFGRYAGVDITEVPLDYLKMLGDAKWVFVMPQLRTLIFTEIADREAAVNRAEEGETQCGT